MFHMLHDGQQLFSIVCMFVITLQCHLNLFQLIHIKPHIYQIVNVIHVASIPT